MNVFNKKNYTMLVLFFTFLFPISFFSQSKEIVNPKGKWYFGAEIGLNEKTTVHPSRMTALQGGLLAEYYFAKNWSVSGRIKYFETGILDSYRYFDGSVVSIPVNLVWKYRIFHNFNGNLKLGFAMNQELKSNYYFGPNDKTDFSKFYGNINSGIGFNYFLSDKVCVYLDYEAYVLGNDRNGDNSFFPVSPDNNLLNFGLKYNFAK
jgi:hypothetical protein